MAKHGIVITPKRKITEPVEHPDKRRAKVADDVAEFLASGGKIKKVRRGKSGIELKVFRSRKQVRAQAKKWKI